MHAATTTRRHVRGTFQILLPRLRRAAASALEKETVLLYGEALDVRSAASDQLIVTLMDSIEERALEVYLPAGTEAPQIGDMLAIEGSFNIRSGRDEASLKLFFNGQCIAENRGRSARALQHSRQIAQIRNTMTPRAQVSRPLRRIALITGPHSKAKGDFERALYQGGVADLPIQEYSVELNNALAIASGISEVASDEYDLIVVARGGGSKLALRPFDDPKVAGAIATVAANIPVMVAVGHAADRVAAAEFASFRAIHTTTPTAAGNLVVRIQKRLLRKRRIQRRLVKMAVVSAMLTFLIVVGLTC